MARAIVISQTGVGTTQWFVVNPHITPFKVGYATELTSGSATWSVEVTYDSPLPTIPWDTVGGGSPGAAPTPTAVAWPQTSAVTAASQGQIDNPAVQAVRLNVTVGTGTVKLVAQQEGIRN